VGQGPSAEGKGKDIDACDFVVRMKSFWLYGAENAGSQTHAVANNGWWEDSGEPAPVGCEHWCALSLYWLWTDDGYGWGVLKRIPEKAGMNVVRFMPPPLYSRAAAYVGTRSISTGFAAICMALTLFPKCELVLYGFDSTTPNRPNYWDAREKDRGAARSVGACHQLTEKRAIAEIAEGRFLGTECAATLTWPDMPELK